MKDKIKNKKIVISVSIILIFSFLSLALLVNLKKLKGTANNDMLGFKDKNLYNCVIANAMELVLEGNYTDEFQIYEKIYDKYENFLSFNIYEGLFGDGLNYDMAMELMKVLDISISMNDIKKISILSCEMEIKDYSGIENLESLKSLHIEGNVGKLDLSKNENLDSLSLTSYREKYIVEELVLPSQLENLYIRKYDIRNINISGDENLTSINIEDSDVSNISFSENAALSNIYIRNSNFNILDLSKIKKASTINISGNVDTIDLSNIEVNANIDIDANVNTLKLPKKTNTLSYLSIINKNINFIDLSSYDSISNLYIDMPNLNVLGFKDSLSIGSIRLANCNLDILDVSKINMQSLLFNQGTGKTKIRLIKAKEYIGSLPKGISEVQLSDGSYIKFNNEKVMFNDGYIIFKDKEITIGDILNDNSIIGKQGFDIKICQYNHCQFGTINNETDVKINTLVGKFLNIYNENTNTPLKSYQLDVFDNKYFDDYDLYRSIINSNSLGDYTAIELSDEQLQAVTSLSLSVTNTTNYKGIEKLSGLKRLSISGTLGFDEISNIPNNLFDKFPNLEDINITNLNFNELNLCDLLYLKTISLSSSNINDFIVNNNPRLESIYTYSTHINNIKLFENNTNNVLKKIEMKNAGISSLDVSSLLELDYLYIPMNNLKQLDITKNTKLTSLFVSDNKLEELNIDNNSNLRNLNFKNNNLTQVDFSNNSALETLDFSNNNELKVIKGTKNIPHDGTLNLSLKNLEELDLTGCDDIYQIMIISSNINTIDISDCKNLSAMMLISNNLEEIKGLNEASGLFMLMIPYSNIKSLDLSSMTNLQALNAQFSPVTKNNINLLVGDRENLSFNLKLPEHMVLEHYNEDDYFAEYNTENNLIIASNPGQTAISSYFISLNYTLEQITKAPLKTYVNVYDIKSSKFLINKEYKYIFNENNEANKVLNRYIKVYGEDVSKEIKDNKLYMYSGDKKIFTFDILELTSKDYKIDNTKNIITYSGTFDISKLKVINGTLNKIDNEVQLICNDNIVKTYKLEEK